MHPTRNILLLIETSSGFTRRLIRGISEYSNGQPDWKLLLDEGGTEVVAETWERYSKVEDESQKPAGVIAHVDDAALYEAVLSAGIPIVNVSGMQWNETIPWIDVNNRAIARLVADDFISRGYESLGYCGVTGLPWSERRERFFTEECEIRDVKAFSSFNLDTLQVTPGQARELEAWLLGLPQPSAIMACNDRAARVMADACRTVGLNIPEQVAIIGVDNDSLVCELSEPTLSSVIPNAEKIGHSAASILNTLVTTGTFTCTGASIEPIGIETRRSTDAAAIGEDMIRLAVRFIHGHAHEGINVDDVLRAVPISRTMLETGFRRVLGRTPLAEITRLRIQRAKQILGSTDLPITKVAEMLGFERVDYFSSVFKRETGAPPTEYRKATREIES